MAPHRVVALPGAVLPAELAYADLRAALGERAEVVAKDLELYATETPPDDWSLDAEVDALFREADARGWDSFHLMGYSGGGAAALGAATRPGDRLLSLALLGPAWAGDWDSSPRHRALWQEMARLQSLPDEQLMPAFVTLSLAPGVPPPPPVAGEPPTWMARRPAGIKAFLRAFAEGRLDREALERFRHPVYLALGGLSNPDQYAEIAERLYRLFPDARLEVFADRHHFNPPHRAEPEALAGSLVALWSRAEQVG
jgi:pimeloyl-ACP methyl ester carboxylesterase